MGVPDKNVEFTPDMISVDLGEGYTPVSASVGKKLPINVVNFGVCAVGHRLPTTDPLEYHENTEEGILPMGGDVILVLAPPSDGKKPAAKDLIAVKVPEYTMVKLFAGTWHWAPIADCDTWVSVQITLPEKTYERDCTVVEYTDLGYEIELDLG